MKQTKNEYKYNYHWFEIEIILICEYNLWTEASASWIRAFIGVRFEVPNFIYEYHNKLHWYYLDFSWNAKIKSIAARFLPHAGTFDPSSSTEFIEILCALLSTTFNIYQTRSIYEIQTTIHWVSPWTGWMQIIKWFPPVFYSDMDIFNINKS